MAFRHYGDFQIRTNKKLQFFESSGSNFVSLKSASSLSADLELILPSTDTANGAIVSDGAGNLSIALLVNANISGSAAIAYSKLNLSNSIVNADINASAAIAYSKLAALTASRALQSDGSGFVSASSVTSTELGYLSGVTSSIQSQFNSWKWKEPVRSASTGNINLASLPATIDGITMASGERFLAKDQSTGSQNGIYTYSAAAGSATRSVDADASAEFPGLYVHVNEGTANADTLWFCSNNQNFVLDTDTPSFNRFYPVSSATAGDGLAFSSGVLSVNVDNSTIEISTDILRVKDAGITNAKIATGVDAVKIADGSVSNAEFQFINSLTSNAQTQIDGKASTALSNLASVAINTSLISDTNATDDLGSLAISWRDAYLSRALVLKEVAAPSVQANAIQLLAPADVTALGYNFVLPVNAGTSGYVLSTDGSGNTSWVSNASSSSFAEDWTTAQGTSKVVTHNLGSKDVLVEVYDKANDESISVDSIVRTDTNTVTLTSSEAPNASSWRVLILKI